MTKLISLQVTVILCVFLLSYVYGEGKVRRFLTILCETPDKLMF